MTEQQMGEKSHETDGTALSGHLQAGAWAWVGDGLQPGVWDWVGEGLHK